MEKLLSYQSFITVMIFLHSTLQPIQERYSKSYPQKTFILL